MSEDGAEWWHRYTYVGVDPLFPMVPNSDELVMHGTVAALKAIRPDCGDIIDEADRLARRYKCQLRFLIKSRSQTRLLMKITSTISVWPDPCQLFVTLTDTQANRSIAADPVPLGFYSDAFRHARHITVQAVKLDLSTSENTKAAWAEFQSGHDTRADEERFVSKLVTAPR